MTIWNTPPGTIYLPDDLYDDRCHICGDDTADCQCPECPECGDLGNPSCLIHHNLEAPHMHNCCREWLEDQLRSAQRVASEYDGCTYLEDADQQILEQARDTIARITEIGIDLLPRQDENGHYVDSDGFSLTDPYVHLTWVVSLGAEDDEHWDETGDMMLCADCCMLNRGTLLVHIVANSESGGFVDTHTYEVMTVSSEDDARDAARDIFDAACDCLDYSSIGDVDQETVTGIRSTDIPWFEITKDFGNAAAAEYRRVNHA